jgi:putative GTP pyrophosphokinase
VTEPGRTPDDWGRRYEATRASYEDFTDALTDLVARLLEETPVDVTQVEARTKTVESFVEKIARKGYTDPLRETTDLAGVRIIVYDPADCRLVGEMIGNEFDVDEENSTAWSIDDDPERFGYRSDHYQVSLTADRCVKLEWGKFSELCAEIQVRTVMQHAWAAVDHKIGYKREGLPPEIRHRLSRLSALLELADVEFEEALADSRMRKRQHARSVAGGELSAGIDSLSMAAFLDETGLGRHWSERAIAVKYLEPRSKQFDVTSLVGTARAIGLSTLGDFQKVFADFDGWGDDVLREILDYTLAGWPPDHEFAGIPAHEDLVLILLLLVAADDLEAVEATPLRHDIKDAVLQVMGSTAEDEAAS